MIPLVVLGLLLAARAAVPSVRLASDPAWVSRSARHFGCAREAVVPALAQATASRYPPGDYTVWLTHKSGLVYPTLQHREKPTPILVLPLATRTRATVSVETATGNPIEPFRPAEYVVVITEPATESVERPVYTEALVKVGEEG